PSGPPDRLAAAAGGAAADALQARAVADHGERAALGAGVALVAAGLRVEDVLQAGVHGAPATHVHAVVGAPARAQHVHGDRRHLVDLDGLTHDDGPVRGLARRGRLARRSDQDLALLHDLGALGVQRVVPEVLLAHVRELVAAQVRDGQLAEDV